MFRLFNVFQYARMSTISSAINLPTIYALSTPPGQRSAIALIRVTGTQSKYIYHKLTGKEKNPVPRKAMYRNLYMPGSNILLDSTIVLYFKAPHSFTGEDIIELHCHGGRAVTSAILNSIQALNDMENGIDIRYAGPGEFSRRSFQNDKFDLTELESINQLIDSETELQRRCALSSFNGENKVMFQNWRQTLIENMAPLTAIVDFGEEIEIEGMESILNNIKRDVLKLKKEVQSFIERIEKSSILQNGIRISLLGKPNAGKSSLINSLTNNDVSIVSSIPGTTRDSIDAPIDINGYKVIITDTAGLREQSDDIIENLGIERAIEKSKRSDICLFVLEADSSMKIDESLNKLLLSKELQDKKVILVVNKEDLIINKDELRTMIHNLNNEMKNQYPILPISCLNQCGISDLIDLLTKEFKELSDTSDGADPIIMSQRVKDILINDVIFGLNSFIDCLDSDIDIVLATENLNLAIEGIGKITGQVVGIEEVLDVVFANFCVGK
ncbi:hypothetical protein NCAS_0A12760 [Naumovozyma castellii]|uniref:TrmE-type G domain-containing protein n=1 Tax=Naumovozyma castellii TaxID=27288 RepID=G0V8N5_NAUCA|nr:hypothetical protein NCAS_0A12760 [Naumovozyma castellii CBS 4309]CCC67834.1 hypothetical protein NCAS_0A12760 [Naumovozyma castellii CBS 4309]